MIVGVVVATNENKQEKFPLNIPPWALPVTQYLSAIDRSIAECVIFGCNTIYIVVDYEQYDGIYKHIKNKAQIFSRSRRVSLITVPLTPKKVVCGDFMLDSFYGMETAWLAATQISKNITPDLFYVTSVFWVYDPTKISLLRPLGASQWRVIENHEGYIGSGFTVNKRQYELLRTALTSHVKELRKKNAFRNLTTGYAQERLASFVNLWGVLKSTQKTADIDALNLPSTRLENFYETLKIGEAFKTLRVSYSSF